MEIPKKDNSKTPEHCRRVAVEVLNSFALFTDGSHQFRTGHADRMDRVGTTCRTRRVKRHLDFGFRGTSRIPTGPSRCFQGFDRCPPPFSISSCLPSTKSESGSRRRMTTFTVRSALNVLGLPKRLHLGLSILNPLHGSWSPLETLKALPLVTEMKDYSGKTTQTWRKKLMEVTTGREATSCGRQSILNTKPFHPNCCTPFHAHN